MCRVIFIFFIPLFSFAHQEDCFDSFSVDEYMSYPDAKHYVQNIVHPKSKRDFYAWLFSDERPVDFPKDPGKVYKEEWEDIDEFLGIPEDDGLRETYEEHKLRKVVERSSRSNGSVVYPSELHLHRTKFSTKPKNANVQSRRINVKSKKKKPTDEPKDYPPFEEAREYVRSLGFRNRSQYKVWAKERTGTVNVPENPDEVYADKWKSWNDFLGIEELMTYEEAMAYIKPFGFRTFAEFQKWSASEQRPSNFPSDPRRKYKEHWINWQDFLGVES